MASFQRTLLVMTFNAMRLLVSALFADDLANRVSTIHLNEFVNAVYVFAVT